MLSIAKPIKIKVLLHQFSVLKELCHEIQPKNAKLQNAR